MHMVFHRFIKFIIPSPLQKFLRKHLNQFRLLKILLFETRRMSEYAYELNYSKDIHNYYAQLTLYTHALEKGLSNPNFREGFGQSVINKLKAVMVDYKNAEHSLEDYRFLSAYCVLLEYCKAHDDKKEYTSEILAFLKTFSIKPLHLPVGTVEYKKNMILEKSKSTFADLALSRVSVRDFSPIEVDDEIIFNAINIAVKSPSSCNRQSWRVHLIKNKDLITRIVDLQKGLRGNGSNLQKLIFVTVDLRYFSGIVERNQGYVDGGIFLMSLVYALTYNEVGTCILNAIFDRVTEKKMRNLIGIEESEIMIGFIALGNYPEKFKSPASLRDSWDRFLTIH